MRLLLVSDLHYALKQFDWLNAVAPSFDVVVLAGDHLDIAGQLDGSVQIVVILNYLKRLAARANIIVSSGNHDLDVRDAAGEKIASWMQKVRLMGIPADGDTIRHGETLVTICPWWDGPQARESVAAQLARDARAPKQNWVWVYHAPPEGSVTSWNGQKFHGDAELTGWIETYQPNLVLCGHIHQAPFRAGGSWVDRMGNTWVFNCGRQIGPEPAHIVIDTDRAQAAWFSQAGDEAVRLDAPLARPLAEAPAWLAVNTPDRDPSRV